MDLFEQKFVELNYTDNRPSHNGDAAKECEKLIRAEESKVKCVVLQPCFL